MTGILARTFAWGRVLRAATAPLTLALALVAFAPGTAHALTITGPRITFDRGFYSVSLASTDPTGVVTLMRNGQVVGKVRGYPGHTTKVGTVLFALPRRYHLTASLDATPAPIPAPEFDVTCYLRPGRGQLLNVVSGQVCGRSIPLAVKVDRATQYAVVYVNGVYKGQGRPYSDGTIGFGKAWVSGSDANVTIITGNPAGRTSCVYRLGVVYYPSDWHTCIIISTEDLKLYWLDNDVLVNWYWVATGRPSLPTPHGIWRIGEKYITDWGSVYGPRKMRLFRLRGGVYEYTAYNIHGTNDETSIRTYASHGCIRMYNRDVLTLYPQVDIGTPVQTR